MDRTVVLFDQSCGFCRWSMARIMAWDRHRRIRAVPLQDPQADGLLDGMEVSEKFGSWHLVAPGGRVLSAGEAVAPLLRLLPLGRPLAALAVVSPRATHGAYRMVARHRESLGRMLGAAACSVTPGRGPSAPTYGGPAVDHRGRRSS